MCKCVLKFPYPPIVYLLLLWQALSSGCAAGNETWMYFILSPHFYGMLASRYPQQHPGPFLL